MPKKIKLSVDDPCQEDWQQMKPAGADRFCGSCQKRVHDFTKMSDAALLAFFKKPSNGSVCGRFLQHQLDRSLQAPSRHIPWARYFLQILVPAFLFSAKATAQGKIKLTESKLILPMNNPGKKSNPAPIHSMQVIEGRVTDPQGNGVPYASVFIKGSSIGMAADSTGYFRLSYKEGIEALQLECSAVGFETACTSLLSAGEIPLRIILPYKMMEEVVVSASTEIKGGVRTVGEISVISFSMIDTLKSWFLPASPILKVYPNPVAANSFVSLAFDQGQQGKYSIRLLGINGQPLLSTEYAIETKNQTIKLAIPALVAGVYLLEATEKKTGRSKTQKLLIQ